MQLRPIVLLAGSAGKRCCTASVGTHPSRLQRSRHSSRSRRTARTAFMRWKPVRWVAVRRIPNAGSHSCSRTRCGRLSSNGEVFPHMQIIGCGGKFIAVQRGYRKFSLGGMNREVNTALVATAGQLPTLGTSDRNISRKIVNTWSNSRVWVEITSGDAVSHAATLTKQSRTDDLFFRGRNNFGLSPIVTIVI